MDRRRPTSGQRARPVGARPAARRSVRDMGAPNTGGNTPPRRDNGPGFSRIIGTLVLVAILGGLIAYLVLNQNQSKPGAGTAQDALPASATPDTKLTVFDLSADPVQSIEVRQLAKGTATEKAVALKLDDANGWQLTAPQQAPADSDKVTQVVADLTKLSATGLVVDKGTPNPGGYGLDQPTARITLTAKSGKATTFTVGNQNPAKSGRYISLANDERVWLVANTSLDTVLAWPNIDLRKLSTIPALPTKDPNATLTPGTVSGTPALQATPGTVSGTPAATTPATTTAPVTPASPTPAG